jgi:hypothetical protein
MTEKERRKGGGGKLSRSETVTVRLDPKLRYLVELAARQQRRTVSSFIEWAIEEMLCQMPLRPKGMPGLSAIDATIMSEGNYLWDVEEADRFAKLAINHPGLLTHEEQLWWKIIIEEPMFWDTEGRDPNVSFQFKKLREYWDGVKRYAAGEISKQDFLDILIPF